MMVTRGRSVLLCALLAVALGGCTSTRNWGGFEAIAVRQPEGLQVLGERVRGASCRAFLVPNNIAAAARSALAEAPGATGLVDVSVTAGLFGLFNCVWVSGTPVK